jgi:type I restriction enzyme R subunit
MDGVAAGRRDDDAISTLAARLAALDRKIGDKARAAIANAAGGLDAKALAHKLLDSVDPDAIEREAATRQVTPEAAAEVLKEEACRPFDDPDLRRLLKDIKRQTEIRIDTISTDAVISSGYDAARAQRPQKRKCSVTIDRQFMLRVDQIGEISRLRPLGGPEAGTSRC